MTVAKRQFVVLGVQSVECGVWLCAVNLFAGAGNAIVLRSVASHFRAQGPVTLVCWSFAASVACSW